MSVRRACVLGAMLLAALVGCTQHSAGSAATAKQGAAPPEIQWFKGDVNAAFAEAAATGKPVFLYWGAVWCPPCHELKATVFSRPDFVEKLKLFVPVYIDGDAPGAQKWGDEFHVTGYPSVVVLRADRTEIARINGGMDLSLYAEVLDLVLGDVKPAAQLLAAVSGDASLSRDDCRRLAYNGWDFDGTPAQIKTTSQQLQLAARNCSAGAKVESARLIALAAAAAVDAEKEKLEGDAPPSDFLVERIRAVQQLLEDHATSLAAADALQYLGTHFFEAVKRALPDHGAVLLASWSAVMEAAAVDARFAEADQIGAIGMNVRAMKILRDDIPAEVADAARKRVEAALARGQTGYARAGVVNSVLFVLDTLGDNERVYAVSEAEMKTSHYPFYYMLDLASIEEDRGNTAQAMTLFERAYQESQGAATRFQWGTEYVLAMIRMQPKEEARIRDAALAVLGELDGPDRIHRRTVLRLKKLDTNLAKWNAGGAHKAAIAVLRAKRDALCKAIPATDSARKDCEGFLSKS